MRRKEYIYGYLLIPSKRCAKRVGITFKKTNSLCDAVYIYKERETERKRGLMNGFKLEIYESHLTKNTHLHK